MLFPIITAKKTLEKSIRMRAFRFQKRTKLLPIPFVRKIVLLKPPFTDSYVFSTIANGPSTIPTAMLARLDTSTLVFLVRLLGQIVDGQLSIVDV
jgi:hypothetical protein